MLSSNFICLFQPEKSKIPDPETYSSVGERVILHERTHPFGMRPNEGTQDFGMTTKAALPDGPKMRMDNRTIERFPSHIDCTTTQSVKTGFRSLKIWKIDDDRWTVIMKKHQVLGQLTTLSHQHRYHTNTDIIPGRPKDFRRKRTLRS